MECFIAKMIINQHPDIEGRIKKCKRYDPQIFQVINFPELVLKMANRQNN